MRHADHVQRMMLILISEAISNSNAVIQLEFRKRHFQMIDNRTAWRGAARSSGTPETGREVGVFTDE